MTTNTILLVEDDENDAFFLERAMHKIGMANPVQNARDGQEAIDYLKGTGKFGRRAEFPLPGLILLDLKLPLVMGLDVLKWIRQNPELSPIVVILSSSADESDIASAYRLGANAYLVKPSEVSKLEGMVRSINDFWLLQNTPPPNRKPQSASFSRRNQRDYASPEYDLSRATGSRTATFCQTDL
ncbi:MAG TPA: response regulator [Verrucomicrobiae bacterium]|nr:response regulator [Verrucomicrobiae bacterium]